MATPWKTPTRSCTACGLVTRSWRLSEPLRATCCQATWASRCESIQPVGSCLSEPWPLICPDHLATLAFSNPSNPSNPSKFEPRLSPNAFIH
eukprot:6215944-Pyramimonas_sp.AAC.2